jgi:predicted nucleic-acid-binding Zn-ribbon protein
MTANAKNVGDADVCFGRSCRSTGGKHLPGPAVPSVMVHCPECEGEIADQEDVEFVDMDAKMAGLFRSSKRFYVVACNECGAAIGSGVAGGSG